MDCKRCSAPVTYSDRMYCSKECYSGEKRERDARNKRAARNLKKSARLWEEKNPGADIRQAWPHKFGDDLLCEHCNCEWSENQGDKPLPCTNKEVYMEVVFNRYGRPKIIKGGRK